MTKLFVRDLMTQTSVAVAPADDLQVVHDLMDDRGIRHVPVVDGDGDVVGIVSERDLVRRALALAENLTLSEQQAMMREVTVETIMTTDVETVQPDAELALAGRLMLDNKYGCLPVVEGAHLTGILTEADFVRFLSEPD